MWSIWRERNSRCFEDREIVVEELKNILVKMLIIYGHGHMISYIFLTFLNLWVFILLSIISGGYRSCMLGFAPLCAY
jgi:hypothetical protein